MRSSRLLPSLALVALGCSAGPPPAAPTPAPALASPNQPPADALAEKKVSSDEPADDLATLRRAEAEIASTLSGEAKAPSAQKEAAPQSTSPAGGRCVTACAALASMTRATEHLCSVAGEADARCSDARTRTKAAASRVWASCPGCP